jgi:hypothetical protein
MKRLIGLVLFISTCFAQTVDQLFLDLETVRKIDLELKDRLPLTINYQLQGGYFTMPTARTYDTGEIALSYSYVPPYRIWNAAFQFFDHIEATGNYWIYRGVLEGNFGHLGFGDDAERAVNVKFILLRKEDGFSFLPEFALGWNDFMGSCRFSSFYGVATQEFLSWNLEASLGWGAGRISGPFGGLAWSPLRHCNKWVKGLSFVAEYDANDYRRHRHEHKDGRKVDFRINAGFQYRFLDRFQASASSIRGRNWAASIAFHYNLGESNGLYPKIYDLPVYSCPIDHEDLGLTRSREEFAQELAYAFKGQGFDLYSLKLVPKTEGKDWLWMKIVNIRYREEDLLRVRLQHILGGLLPNNVLGVTCVIEADGIIEQEYQFRSEDLRRYTAGKMGEDEFRVIAPLKEVSKIPNNYESIPLYKRSKKIWLLTFRPWLRNFFGSSTGKYKYETGFSLGPEGYLFGDIYYSLYGTWTLFSSLQKVGDRDILNPSRLLVVRTDALFYNRSNSFHVEKAFIQKSWNLGQGWFLRTALGYFEMAYAGASLETLYYPVNSDWAIGLEVSPLLKREYFGFGFQRKVRKLTDEGDKFFPYTGLQYFADFYYEYKPYHLEFKARIGQFLAKDKGIRFEVSRVFPSALRVGLWYTLTNANDEVNRHRYYDKGVTISMPLDLFLNQSSRTRISYSMAAWLRDCGASAAIGKRLYPTLYYERFNPSQKLY